MFVFLQINADCRQGAPAGVICGSRRFFMLRAPRAMARGMSTDFLWREMPV